MVLAEPVAAHPDGREIGIACPLQEVPRQRHAVLQRDPCSCCGTRHAVHEQLARGQIARGNRRAGEPILFVHAHAGFAEISHPGGPKRGIGGHVAGYRMRLPVGAVRSIQRLWAISGRPSRLRKAASPSGRAPAMPRSDRCRRPADPAVPRAVASLRVEPAVELNVAQPNVHRPGSDGAPRASVPAYPSASSNR